MATQAQNVIQEHERGDPGRISAPTQDDVVTFIHENPIRETFYDTRVSAALAIGIAFGGSLVLVTFIIAKLLG